MADATEQKNDSLKEVEAFGFKFTINPDLLDDVEAFELIDRIENKGQSAGIVELVKYMVGTKGLDDMKAHFKQQDATEHAEKLKAEGKPADPTYEGRFRVSKLLKVYEVIVANYDPKG